MNATIQYRAHCIQSGKLRPPENQFSRLLHVGFDDSNKYFYVLRFPTPLSHSNQPSGYYWFFQENFEKKTTKLALCVTEMLIFLQKARIFTANCEFPQNLQKALFKLS